MYVQFRGSKLADGRDRGANGSIIEGVHGLRVYQKFVADDAAVDALEAEALDIHGAEEFHIELYNEEAPPFEGFLVWLNRGIPGKSAYQVALVAGDVFVMNDAGKTIQKFVIPGKGSIQGLMSQEEKVFGFPSEMIASYREDAKDGPGRGIFQPPRNYTTDRNACALVLDALKEKSWFKAWVPFCIHFLIYLNNETTCKPNFEYGDKGFKDLSIYDAGGFMDKLLRADPDLICYCAVKAIKDE